MNTPSTLASLCSCRPRLRSLPLVDAIKRLCQRITGVPSKLLASLRIPFKNESHTVAAQCATSSHTPQCPSSTWPSLLFKTRYTSAVSEFAVRLFRRLEQPLFKALDSIAVKRKSAEINMVCVLRSRLALRFQGVSRARHDVPRA